jgi:hypothetical protein
MDILKPQVRFSIMMLNSVIAGLLAEEDFHPMGEISNSFKSRLLPASVPISTTQSVDLGISQIHRNAPEKR